MNGGDLFGRARLGNQILSGQQQGAWVMTFGNRMGPGACSLGAIARPPDVEPWNHAQARRMFNRLMGRTIFAYADGVVGEDVDDPDFHQRSHSDGITTVITKSQKSPTVRNEPSMECDPVERGCHTEFTHTVVHITAPRLTAANCPAAGEVGQV